jgi:hypothetical protein
MRHVPPTAGVGPTLPARAGLALAPAGPNPFHGATTLEYSLPRASDVRIEVLDVEGREVALLANQNEDAGSRRVTWEAKDAAAGLYFAKLTTGQGSATARLLLLR